MLLELENTDQKKLDKLMQFARQNQIKLSRLDDNDDNYFLPGKPLSADELTGLIEAGRNSGKITMENAHEIYKIQV